VPIPTKISTLATFPTVFAIHPNPRGVAQILL
jgi:hypothetical protein